MTFRDLFLCTLMLATVGCSKATEPAAAKTAVATAVEQAPTATTTPAVEAPKPATPATTAAIESATTATAALKDSDFTVIAAGAPYKKVERKIEVVEFFNYICPACNAFDPLLQAWKAKLPADVNLVYVPADFRGDFAVYARAYYAADLLGLVEKTHHAVYEAIHDSHQLPGEGRTPEVEPIANFYSHYGVTAKAFTDAMDSFAVNMRMNQGHQYMVQSQIRSTPSLLVNGRYLVNGSSFEDKLRIAGQLIDRERQAKAASK